MPTPVDADRDPAETRRFQVEKMAVLGEIMVGIAHDINTPIAYVASNLTSLEAYIEDIRRVMEKVGPAAAAMAASEDPALCSAGAELADLMSEVGFDEISEDLAAAVGESIEGAEQVKGITDDLRRFSRDDRDEPILADLNESLELSLRIARNELKYNTEVQCDLGEIPRILCRPGEIQQVFVNLLINASHAIGDKGIVRVSSSQEDGHVVVRISDTGCGIPEELRDRVFEPFFTTKEPGKGTGVGLSVAREILHAHGGTIGVESAEGRGTTFTLRLPCVS